VKDNLQLPEEHPATVKLGEMVLAAAGTVASIYVGGAPATGVSADVQSVSGGWALTARMWIRRSDRRRRQARESGRMFRLPCFFLPRRSMKGGELHVEDTYGVHSVKLPAGHMVLYPATSLHRVSPVTRGARVASFFWVAEHDPWRW